MDLNTTMYPYKAIVFSVGHHYRYLLTMCVHFHVTTVLFLSNYLNIIVVSMDNKDKDKTVQGQVKE